MVEKREKWKTIVSLLRMEQIFSCKNFLKKFSRQCLFNYFSLGKLPLFAYLFFPDLNLFCKRYIMHIEQLKESNTRLLILGPIICWFVRKTQAADTGSRSWPIAVCNTIDKTESSLKLIHFEWYATLKQFIDRRPPRQKKIIKPQISLTWETVQIKSICAKLCLCHKVN